MENRPQNYRPVHNRPITRSLGLLDLSTIEEQEEDSSQPAADQQEQAIHQIVLEQEDCTMATPNIRLKQFNGEDSPHLWLSTMDAWQAISGYNEEKLLSVLPLLLDGPAAVWLSSLPAENKAALADFKTALLDRFGRKDTDFSSFLFQCQLPTESALEFVQKAEKNGLGLKVDEIIKVQATLQDLQPAVKAKCIGREPKTFTELRKAIELAMAEQLCLQSVSSEPSSVSAIQDLYSSFSQLTNDLSNNFQNQVQQITSALANKPPQKRQNNQQPQRPFQSQHGYQPRPQQQYQPQQQQYHNQRQCPGCGKSCQNRRQCPANNKQCNFCGIWNHFEDACRRKKQNLPPNPSQNSNNGY